MSWDVIGDKVNTASGDVRNQETFFREGPWPHQARLLLHRELATFC